MHARRTAAFATVLALAGLAAGVAFAHRPGRKGGERYALLVGVRKYDPNELRSLPYSEADVTELAAVLKASGYKPGNVVPMTQTLGAEDTRLLPLAANVRKELRLVLDDLEERDSVVVALAGHGVRFRGEAESYFCSADARLADKATLIVLREVYKELEASGAGLKVLLVDACRNDPQSDNSRARAAVSLASVTRPQVRRPPGGVAALFSCSEGEKAFENADLKHGVFAHFLIRGLKGEADLDRDGVVELDELARFAKKRVPDFVKDAYGPDVRHDPGRELALLPPRRPVGGPLLARGRLPARLPGVPRGPSSVRRVSLVGWVKPTIGMASLGGFHPPYPADHSRRNPRRWSDPCP